MAGVLPPEDQAARDAATTTAPKTTTNTKPAATTSAATGGSTAPPTVSPAPGTSDYTDDAQTRFNGVPGWPEVWQDADTGQYYLVYYVPGMKPAIPLLFAINTQEELKSLFGNQPISIDTKASSADIQKAGSIFWGSMSTIDRYNANMDLIKDPWAGFTERMERAKQSFPWMADDPEVLARVAAAYLEGRDLEDWELEGTDYYDTHSKAQRDALRLAISDPTGYADRLGDYTLVIKKLFARHGMDANDQVASWVANQYNAGNWSLAQAETQIAIFAGRSDEELDAGFSTFLADSDLQAGAATSYTTEIAELFRMWLGPNHIPTDDQIQRWATRFTSDYNGGKDALEAMLSKQRVALYSAYEDPTLTYDDISGPWRTFTSNVWGIPIDDTDVEFQKIVQMNDAQQARQHARAIGSDRGYERIVEDMRQQLEASMRGGVRGRAF